MIYQANFDYFASKKNQISCTWIGIDGFNTESVVVILDNFNKDISRSGNIILKVMFHTATHALFNGPNFV